MEARNRQIAAANRHNAKVIGELNQRLRAAGAGPGYTEAELALADQLQAALPAAEEREVDTFLSYARIDGPRSGRSCVPSAWHFASRRPRSAE